VSPSKVCLVVDTIWTFVHGIVLLLCSVYPSVVALMYLLHRRRRRVEPGVEPPLRSTRHPAAAGLPYAHAGSRGRRGCSGCGGRRGIAVLLWCGQSGGVMPMLRVLRGGGALALKVSLVANGDARWTGSIVVGLAVAV
jgi:hypothetical protein